MRIAVLTAVLLITCCRAEGRNEKNPEKPLEAPEREFKIETKRTASSVPEEKVRRPEVSRGEVEIPNSSETRTNVVLAAAKIERVTIPPNGSFSFNEAVGERTEERGFVKSKVIFDGAETEGVGGGVCQVSTALYIALMEGGFKVTERHPHSRPRTYVPLGEDSAVNWKDLDLRFVNDGKEEVTIRASVLENILTVSLEGKREKVGVESKWNAAGRVPFETRRIKSRYMKKELLHRRGADGSPGTRTWRYEDGRVLVVPSSYKPTDEVLVVPDP